MGNMNKLAIAGALLAGIAAARADVVAWWRFDEIGSDNKVVNSANPGTYDGYLTTGSAASNGVWPADAANMPIVTNSFSQAFPRVMDPLTGTVRESGKALLWNGTAVKGGVVVPYEDAKGLLLEDFTIEAFVRIPPEAASRSNQMFPIVHFGNDSGTGYMFSVWDNSMSKGYLFFRQNGSGWSVWKDHATYMPGIYDGRWHHLAVAFDGNSETKKSVSYLYVDGEFYAKFTASWPGWEFSKEYPLTIGRHLYQTARTFMGEIAEVRISNTLLSGNQFLVPLADRPALVDDDTAVMLTFDTAKNTGYGFETQTLVPCIYNNTSTTCVWTAKNWNLQSAAYSSPFVPRWWSFNDYLSDYTYQDELFRPLQDETDVPGENLYGNALESGADPEAASLKIRTNGADDADIVVVPSASGIVSNSVTVELFFKTDTADNKTVTLVFCGFLKWCVYQGKLLARTFTGASHDYNGAYHITSSGKVNDGEWHHAAYIYDKDTGRVAMYLDYALVDMRVVTPYVNETENIFVGGESRTYQAFAGNIDDVRITRRALRPWEFLTTHAATSAYLMDAPLESDYSAGHDTTLAPTGTTGVLTASETSGDPSEPSIVKVHEGYVSLDGAACQSLRYSGHALRLDGGYVKWPYNRLLDYPEITLEFFARLDDLGESANLVRLSGGTEVNGTPVWTLWQGSEAIQLTTHLYTNNTTSTTYSFGHFHEGIEADGKWHHWAMTAGLDSTGSNTVFTLYKDYEQYGNTFTAKGNIHFPKGDANISVGGTGVHGAFIHGLVNNLRISPGVLDTSKFMRFIPKLGTWIIVR